MNKEYIYIDGKAIVKDEKGIQNPIEYYDNLDEVLIKENLIETIETEIEKLNNEYSKVLQDTKGSKKINFLKKVIIPHVILSIIALFIPSILELLIQIPLSSAIIPNFKTWLTTFSLVLIQILVAPKTLNDYSSYEETLKKKSGLETELKYLNEELIKEKQKLQSLIETKTKETEIKETKLFEVNDLEQLKQLRSNIAFYYDLGYNLEKFCRYYERGILDKKLGRYYTEEGVKEAKEFLEEKGPSLVKVKRK